MWQAQKTGRERKTRRKVLSLRKEFLGVQLRAVRLSSEKMGRYPKIWQSLMPAISENTANTLASNYDFSGGQIENIARKCDVDSILYGTDVINEDRIIQYCADECIVKGEKPKIGFV
jgi:hypothetical protein